MTETIERCKRLLYATSLYVYMFDVRGNLFAVRGKVTFYPQRKRWAIGGRDVIPRVLNFQFQPNIALPSQQQG